MTLRLQHGDLLLVIDVQADFVTGALAVADAAAIIPVINRYAREFEQRDLPVVASRDWHPPDHVSFRERGGPWPAHCVRGLPGAEFAAGLVLWPQTTVISKATEANVDAYSAFDHTHLGLLLRRHEIRRIFACGLATDYCVRATVLDALRLGYAVFVLGDAVRAVNLRPDDGAEAMREMREAGAVVIELGEIDLVENAIG